VIPLLHSKATRDFLDILLSNENGYQLNNGYVFSEKMEEEVLMEPT
jgi:hypothetical protein